VQSFNYVNVGDGLPLAPIINIKVAAPDWLDKSGEYSIEAFLDTGSDCTLAILNNSQDFLPQRRRELTRKI
jgi:hypothetical protein